MSLFNSISAPSGFRAVCWKLNEGSWDGKSLDLPDKTLVLSGDYTVETPVAIKAHSVIFWDLTLQAPSLTVSCKEPAVFMQSKINLVKDDGKKGDCYLATEKVYVIGCQISGDKFKASMEVQNLKQLTDEHISIMEDVGVRVIKGEQSKNGLDTFGFSSEIFQYCRAIDSDGTMYSTYPKPTKEIARDSEESAGSAGSKE